VLCRQDFARKLFEIKIKHARRAFVIAPTRMFIGFPRNEGEGVPLKNQRQGRKISASSRGQSRPSEIFSN
jgi:hypothetical protein